MLRIRNWCDKCLSETHEFQFFELVGDPLIQSLKQQYGPASKIIFLGPAGLGLT